MGKFLALTYPGMGGIAEQGKEKKESKAKNKKKVNKYQILRFSGIQPGGIFRWRKSWYKRLNAPGKSNVEEVIEVYTNGVAKIMAYGEPNYTLLLHEDWVARELSE